MDLSTLRENAKALYGLPQSTTEDSVFTDAVLNMLLNDAHRRAAIHARLYGRTVTADLPAIGDEGYSTVPLDCSVIELVPGTVRANLSGGWTLLSERDEAELLQCSAPEERAADDSAFYFLRPGDQLDAQLVMECYPGVETLVTDGLKYRAYLYPSLMTLDTHTPSFPPAEHTRLLSVACWRMAMLERAQGRGDAPLQLWAEQARADLDELRLTVQGARTLTSGVRILDAWDFR